jgi:two-component system, NtrC family, sensor kinase
MSAAQKDLERVLFERVKELTCLYSIASLASQTDLSLAETMQRIVEILPSGWQYPEIASAQITVDGRSFATPGFRRTPFCQRAEIIVRHEPCGEVLVVYGESRPDGDEGPFLREERNLLNTVASRLGLIVERYRAERDRSILMEQLRHADRLATIGQLAAGVAHELNEPLAAILGLAQLSRKSADLPGQAARDLDKIVQGALHAREVIQKLLLFARRMPPARTGLKLNGLVEEALALLDARRADGGIEVVRSFQNDLPDLTADPSQIRQVLVNLLLNALQATPRGGRIEVQTRSEEGQAVVVVKDTGAGMSAEVLQQLFTPFFTTKDVGEGTGLGLAVVSGIVSSHGGTIHAESEVGHGSRFEIRLPLTPPPESLNPDEVIRS